ncbi:replication initiator [Streptomyces fildesensis]|uniref:Replication initiator n=1 Tax=Streptomyces fildesensis TaxID=375757 RepID=A0ABW8C7R8_9ACTN
MRLDGPDGNSHPTPPYATIAVLAESVRAAAAQVRVTVESDAVKRRQLGWGEQLDVREIAAFGTDAELTDQAVAAYVAKYTTKSADASGTLDHALFCRPFQGRGATLLPHGTPLPCTACTQVVRGHRTTRRPPPPGHRPGRHDPGPYRLRLGAQGRPQGHPHTSQSRGRGPHLQRLSGRMHGVQHRHPTQQTRGQPPAAKQWSST